MVDACRVPPLPAVALIVDGLRHMDASEEPFEDGEQVCLRERKQRSGVAYDHSGEMRPGTE